MSISVIIPCYRAAATLRRAVDSASDEELEAVMGEFLGGSKK